MAKDPAFLLYSSDFLTGTMTMTNEQVGKYMRLLCLQHQQTDGTLSEEDMRSICGGNPDEVIMRKFVKNSEGRYFNQRLAEEVLRRKSHQEKQRSNALMRWHKGGIATAMPLETENENENENEDKDLNAFKIKAFEDFWKLYPSRNGKKLLKKQAFAQFAKLDEAMYPEILMAARNYAASGQLAKDAPRFFKDEYWREWATPASQAEKLSVKTEMPNRSDQPRWDYPPEIQKLVKTAIPKGINA